MPYTTLVAGTTITASWANASVRDQVVTPFATSTARDSAITVPVEGMLSYLEDSNKYVGYDGTAWRDAFLLPGTAFARKPSDETVTSSSTLQNDDDLVLAVLASTTYEVLMVLDTFANNTGNFKFDFSLPAGATLMSSVVYWSTALAVTFVEFTNSAALATGGNNATNLPITLTGLLVVGGTAGNMQLRWAQNTSNGTGSVARTNSFLRLRRVA